MSLKLVIGDKNYSSWSLRAALALDLTGVPYEEILERLYRPDSRARLLSHSPTGKVPVLLTEEGPVWDSLAIAEYLAEQFPELHLWPREADKRARARSVCAEMHSGFAALRGACPMNIEAHLPDVGALALRDKPGVRADLDRLIAMWQQLLAEHGGPLLFGRFSVADAFYAPVVMRLKTYALPVPPEVAAYMDHLCALPGVKAWVDAALAEQDFRDFEEPYRLSAAP